MKKFILFIIITFTVSRIFAATNGTDSLKQHVLSVSPVDSLKQLIQLAGDNDTLKAPIYTKIAAQYLTGDSIVNHKKRVSFQNAAISNTLSAIHLYSRLNDTSGLRLSFDNLAKLYHAQRKLSQAKWFILQSNTLSRAKNDIPNIITSLIELASIKSDNKDYNMSMRDLNEALTLSSKNHLPKLESSVQKNYALLYSHMKNYDKEAIAIKRHDAIEDSLVKAEEAKLVAKITVSDSVQVKKKIYTASNRKVYKGASSRRIASL